MKQFHKIEKEYDRRNGVFGVADITKERRWKGTADGETTNVKTSTIMGNEFQGYRSGGFTKLEQKYHDTLLKGEVKGEWIEMKPDVSSGTSPSMLNIIQGSGADQRNGSHISVTKISLRLKGEIQAKTTGNLSKDDLKLKRDLTQHKALRILILVDRQPTTNTEVVWKDMFNSPLPPGSGGRNFMKFYNNSRMSRYIVLKDVLIPFKREVLTSVSELVTDEVKHRISSNNDLFKYISHQKVDFEVTFDNQDADWTGISENDIKLICVLDDAEDVDNFEDSCLVECNCRVRYLDP